MGIGTMGRYCMVCGTHLRPYELICPNCFPKEKDVKQQEPLSVRKIFGCDECGSRAESHAVTCSRYRPVEDRTMPGFSYTLTKQLFSYTSDGDECLVPVRQISSVVMEKGDCLKISSVDDRCSLRIKNCPGTTKKLFEEFKHVLGDTWQEADMRKEFAKKPTQLECCHICLAVVPDPYKRCPECFPSKKDDKQADKAKSTGTKTMQERTLDAQKQASRMVMKAMAELEAKDDPCVHCGTPRPPKPIHEHCTRCGGILES